MLDTTGKIVVQEAEVTGTDGFGSWSGRVIMRQPRVSIGQI